MDVEMKRMGEEEEVQGKWGDVGEGEDNGAMVEVRWSSVNIGVGEEMKGGYREKGGEGEGEEGEEGDFEGADVVIEGDKVNMFMVLCVIVVSVSSVLLGYDIGVMSGAVIFIREDYQLTDVQQGILIGSLNLVSSVGAIIAGLATDELGRKWIVFLSAFVGFVGSVGMALSYDYSSLMIFRLVNGVAIGIGYVLGPVYIAELSPRSLRGGLVATGEVAVNVGILLGYVSNLAFSGLPGSLAWRVMVGMGAIPGIVLFVMIALLPESPRWLFMHGYREEAKKVLTKAKYTENQIQDILEEIEDLLNKTKGEEVAWKDLICCSTPFIRVVLTVGLGINFFQQACGVETCVYYTPQVLEQAGMTETSQVLAGSVVIGIIKLLFIFPPMLYMETKGRKPFLYASFGGMFAALLLLAMAFSNTLFNSPNAIFILFSIALFMASFSFGIGPGNWVYSSEVFPLKIRGRAMSLGVIVNRAISGTVASTFLPLSAAIGVSGAFTLYAFMCLLGAGFVMFILPETKGMSLEEIEKMFQEQVGEGVDDGIEGEIGGMEVESVAEGEKGEEESGN